jgi:hypothetical protein
MKRTQTHRGFRLYEFKDHYGEDCSLQKSSLADTDAIWLGIDKPKPTPIGGLVSGRMHLTRKQVKALLPKLVKFVETGELP